MNTERDGPIALNVDIETEWLKRVVEKGRLTKFVDDFSDLANKYIKAILIEELAKAGFGHNSELLPLSHEPGIMHIHLLNRCNMFCQHCYLCAAPWCNTYLPAKLVMRSIDDAEKLGIGTIHLSGGEPFLYPELRKVLGYISQQQNLKLCINTNGTLIGTREASQLKDCGASVQVSIDGPEVYHDQFRGVNGAFRHASKGIQNLIDAEVPVTIVITICKDNSAWLPWLAEWAADMRVEHISVQPLLQMGRGSEIRDKKLSDDQLCDLFLQVSDLGHNYSSRGLWFSIAYRTLYLLRTHPCAAYVCDGRCHRKVSKEIKKITIREDGTVLPEIPTLDYRFALGNLHESTLIELVARYFENDTKFHRLCQTIYKEMINTWTSPIVLWDEIVSERSWVSDV